MAGPGGVEAGRAAVIVLPDTSRFMPSLLKYLERVEKRTRLEIPTGIDPDGIREDTERVREQVKRTPAQLPLIPDADQFLKRAQAEAAKAAAKIEAEIPLTADGELLRRKLATEVQAIQARVRQMAVQVPIDAGAAAGARAELLAQIAGLQALASANEVEIPVDVDTKTSAQLRQVRGEVDGLGSSLTSVSGQLAVSAASVGAALLTWGPPILVAAGAAAAMAPAVAAMVPAVGALALGVGSLAVGFQGVGDALKYAFDPEKTKEFNEALKKLSPAARETVKAIQGLAGPWREVRKEVQEALFKGMAPFIKAVGKDLLPALQSGLTAMASLFNATGREMLTFLTSVQGLSLVRQLGQAAAAGMQPLLAAVTPLTSAFLHLAVAAGPAFKQLSLGIAGTLARFSQFIVSASKAGTLGPAISAAMKNMGRVFSVLGQLVGQTIRLLVAIGPASVTVFVGVVNAVLSVIDALRPLGPVIAQNKALFATLGVAVLAFVSPIAAVVGAVALAVAAFRQFGPQIMAFLAPVVAGVQSFGASIMSAFQTIAPAVQGFVAAVLPTLLEIGRQIIGVVGPALAEIGTIIRTQVAPAFAAFLTAITPVATFLLNVLGAAVVGALRGVVNVIKGILTALAGLMNLVAGVLTGDWSRAWEGIKQIASGALRAILGLVQAALNIGVVKLFRTALTAMRALVTGAWAAIRAIWSAGLNGIRSLASGILRGIVGIIRSAVSAYLGAWRTGLTALATAARAGLNAAVALFRGLGGRIVGALRGIPGQLLAIGRNIVQGLVNGIRAGAAAVTAAAQALADKIPGPIRKVLGIASPSKVMIQLARYIGAGLVVGLDGSASDVRKAATGLATKIRDAIRSYTADRSGIAKKIAADEEAVRRAQASFNATMSRVSQSARNAIANAKRTLDNAQAKYAADRRANKPATVIEADRRAIANAQARYQQTVRTQAGSSARALAAARTRLDAAVKKLAADKSAARALDASFAGIARNPKQAAAVTKYIAAQLKPLDAIAKQREKVAERLKAAQDKLSEAIKIRDDYAKSVRDAAVAYADLTKAEAAGDAQLTSGDVVGNLRKRLAALITFRAQMDRLTAAGLNQQALQQLVDAGIDAGSATARAIEEGGGETIAQINQLTSAINSQADRLGTSTAATFYQSGVDIAQGLVEGIEKQADALAKAAKKLADTLIAEVKKRLGIKSPSTVMAGVGENLAAGLVKGMTSQEGMVGRAADRLTAQVIRPAQFKGTGSAKAVLGGAPVNVTVYNPVPETASESTSRIMRRLVVLGASA